MSAGVWFAMNIIFHAGHHKTGTTTFQSMLQLHQAKLLDLDIFVPVVGGTANMGEGIVYRAQRGDWSTYEAVLKQAKSKLPRNGTVVFSAEDLENCLFDLNFGRQFNSIAKSHGFDSAKWIFVQRNQFDYFESIYGELSKHDQVLRYDRVANLILKDGFYACAASKFRWFFVFDYVRAIEGFKKAVTGNVVVVPFHNFLEEPIGLPVFELCGKAAEYAGVVQGSSVSKQNARLPPEEVERKYLENFFGRSFTGSLNSGNNTLLDVMVRQRLEIVASSRPKLRELFERRFRQ